MLTTNERIERARYEALECLVRFVAISIVVLALTFGEVWAESHGATETARRLDVSLVLAAAGMVDSARIAARKARELREAGRGLS